MEEKFGKLVIAALLMIFTFAIPCSAVQTVQVINDGSKLTVKVNGTQVNFDQQPCISNGRTMVPFRAIAEALGAEVDWASAGNKVTISGDKKIELIIGSTKAKVNGNEVTLDTPAAIVAGRTMVPLRFVSEALEANINYVNTAPNPSTGSGGIIAVAAGSSYGLAIKQDGTLWAWGNNTLGQLGDGTMVSKASPVKVMDQVKSVAASGANTLAVKQDGTLWSWGNNYYGQVGDGTTKNRRSTPVQILSDVQTIAVGFDHSLAVKKDGTLWAWGRNMNGQVGDGTTIDRVTPVMIMNGVESISAGMGYSMAIKTDGTLWAWGNNISGVLGNGRGHHLKMKMQNGSQGQLVISDFKEVPMEGATGFETNQTAPVEILKDVKGVSANSLHTFAVTQNGNLFSWGSNDQGVLGDGTFESKATPVQIMSGVTSVATGSQNTIALKEDGTLWYWGDISYGELGNGTDCVSNYQPQNYRLCPVQTNISGVKSIAAGDLFNLAIKGDGTLWVWGYNKDHRLGDGTSNVSQNTPVQIRCGN